MCEKPVQALYDSLDPGNRITTGRITLTLYIAANGSLYQAEVFEPHPGVDYSEFLERLQEMKFPKMKFRKGSGRLRYYPYFVGVEVW